MYRLFFSEAVIRHVAQNHIILSLLVICPSNLQQYKPAYNYIKLQ